jgi:2-octaprenyl-6-methoxyphenol hydroxylase
MRGMAALNTAALHIAIVGAGPVGLALALLAAQRLPRTRISLFDARAADRDVAADPRTLALSLGSVQLLQRIAGWPAGEAAAIRRVHVSQMPGGIGTALGPHQPAVTIDAAALGLDQLGAVLPYGRLLAPLQSAWLAAAQAEPARLSTRFGTPVAAIKALDAGGVEIDAGIAERFDIAVVAEGGVFAEQARKALQADYSQTAWVGTATLAADPAQAGTAFERFTAEGPVALLPLPGGEMGSRQAALVWCVASATDPLPALNTEQRLALLRTRLPAAAGELLALSPLKSFALGLNAERTLVQGATVRIGNAAQTLHPVAGQGLNLGLRDAWTLVDALADGERRGRRLDSALQRVEWARAPDRWALIATTDFLARSFTWRLPGAAALRALGLAAVQALPPLKHALARQMMFGRR